MDPDVVGLSEVDVPPLYQEIQAFMRKEGYADYFVEKPSNLSGSAIFYKRDKFVCLQKNSVLFGDKSSQFFMYCVLAKKAGGYPEDKSLVPSSGTSN